MEKLNPKDAVGAVLMKGNNPEEACDTRGYYKVVCRGADGAVKWEDEIHNVVATVGKNLALDTILAGSAYTVVGPFMGLKGTGSAVAGDTMASHAAWLEVGGANAPTYTSPRKTITFSAAAAGVKASTGTYTFAMTGSGTVAGCFMVFGSGAVSTIDSTAGTLLSAGDFTGGSKTVANGDSLTVTWQLTL